MKKPFKRQSITTKLMLWFAIILILITGISCGVTLYVSDIVALREIKTNLTEIVEKNIYEVELSDENKDRDNPYDDDCYVEYGGGYLEIDGDFTLELSGVKCAIYEDDGSLIYGEEPAVKLKEAGLEQKKLRTVKTEKGKYFVFDMRIPNKNLDGLWVRGIVPEEQGHSQINDVIRMTFFLIVLCVIAAIILTGLIAGRLLRPFSTIASAADHINNSGDLNRRIDIEGESGSEEAYKLGTSFNDMLDRLEASFNEEKRFLSDASHELRTPLAVNSAQCEYILSRDRSKEEYIDALHTIQEHTRRMSRLVGDLLDYTRLDSRGRQIELVRTDLTELVEETAMDMELLAERGITLTYKCEPGVCVKGESGLLGRVLINLISNSFRYGKNDGHISISLEKLGADAVIRVSDDGIGIAAEDIDNIFKRFYQADKSRSGEGTGLGLAMVYEIVRIHGGKVSVTSKVGEGSTFEIKLPIYE